MAALIYPSGDVTSSVVYDHVKEFIRTAPDQIYLAKALLHVPEGQLRRIFGMMEDDGLPAILDNDAPHEFTQKLF